MGLLTEKLPGSVIIDGAEIQINTDFRVSILFTEEATNTDVSDIDVVRRGFELYFPELEKIKDFSAAYEQMMWFFRCGKPVVKRGRESKARPGVFSFKHDGTYIFAAFYQQYGIDLTSAQLHWWAFQALFDSLDENTLFRRIIEYRSVRLEALPKERREFYRRMKKLYALPKAISEEEESRIERLNTALANGEDITALLSEEN
jgi:hypothetical protein